MSAHNKPILKMTVRNSRNAIDEITVLRALPQGEHHLYMFTGDKSVLSDADRSRIEWCITMLDSIKQLGRDKLGNGYPTSIMVIDALKTVLK